MITNQFPKNFIALGNSANSGRMTCALLLKKQKIMMAGVVFSMSMWEQQLRIWQTLYHSPNLIAA